MTDELVYAVPRAVLMGDPGWHGVRTTDVAAYVEAIHRNGTYQPRPAMEHDAGWKQVIPYLVVRDGRRYFLMRRTRSGADARLHDRYTIGVGGHLNPGDGGLDRGLEREWVEEIEADFVPPFRLVGLLNDDTTDVGRVHVGVIYVAEAAGRAVGIRETEKLTGAFAEPAEIAAVAELLEGWSRIVFEALEGEQVR
jgi:predicted NUDIX family phosphoesterase